MGNLILIVMISIIIPIYNSEKKLCRCIDSVLGQTYSDIELLLIDDGSTDASAKICIEYEKSDCRVKYIRKENGGAASARNLGIKEAKGEYIQFVDSDDYIASDMVEMLYKSIVNDNSDLSICSLVSYTNYSRNEIIFKSSIGISINDFTTYICRYYHLGILHSCCNKLYKKTFVKSQMNPNYRWGEDYIFNLEYLANIRKISILDKILYFYDCTDESVTRGKYQKQEEYIKERYMLSLVYLNRIFHSKEINNIISYRYICELFADFQKSNTLWCINSKAIKRILEENRKAIELMQPIDSFSKQIISNDVHLITYKLKKEKIQYNIKNIIKQLIKYLRDK